MDLLDLHGAQFLALDDSLLDDAMPCHAVVRRLYCDQLINLLPTMEFKEDSLRCLESEGDGVRQQLRDDDDKVNNRREYVGIVFIKVHKFTIGVWAQAALCIVIISSVKIFSLGKAALH